MKEQIKQIIDMGGQVSFSFKKSFQDWMVAALFYVGATLAFEAILMKAHYFSGAGFGFRGDAAFSIVALVGMNAAAFVVPLVLGKSHLDRADL
jgi:hypothetical protein